MNSKINPKPTQDENRSKIPKVALLVQTAAGWSRDVLRGIANYAHTQGGWDFLIEMRGFHDQLSLPKNWRGDGIITRLTHPALRSAIRKTGIPAVNISWFGPHHVDLPKVTSDEQGCAKIAADHFLEKAFENYGYVGPIDRPGYKDNLVNYFQQYLLEQGYSCHQFTAEANLSQQNELFLHRDSLTRWLRDLPKPIGLFVWNTQIALSILSVCESQKFDIPNEIAILGCEYDALVSAMAPIPLSSLDLAPTQVGFEAAKLLHRMMQGEASPDEPQYISPLGVVQRQSTDTDAVVDTLVSKALDYIRNHYRHPIQVIDLEKTFQVSRRTLEHRFQKTLNRTPAAEIRRERLAHVKRLLLESDLSLAAISQQAGFNHVEVMIRAFRRELKMTPGDYRKFG